MALADPTDRAVMHKTKPSEMPEYCSSQYDPGLTFQVSEKVRARAPSGRERTSLVACGLPAPVGSLM